RLENVSIGRDDLKARHGPSGGRSSLTLASGYCAPEVPTSSGRSNQSNRGQERPDLVVRVLHELLTLIGKGRARGEEYSNRPAGYRCQTRRRRAELRLSGRQQKVNPDLETTADSGGIEGGVGGCSIRQSCVVELSVWQTVGGRLGIGHEEE